MNTRLNSENSSSFLFTNIRSVLSKSVALSSLVDSTCASLLILTETWLDDTIPDANILLSESEFCFFRCDRKNRKGGGVLIATKKQISAVPITVTTFLECVWIRCKIGIADVVIAAFYRPPDMTATFSGEFHRILSDLYVRFPNSIFLVFGDFNFPNIDWPNLTVNPSDQEAHMFLHTCLDFSLVQLITDPTRRSATTANILDLVLTNNPEVCFDILHLQGLSDHEIITGYITRPFGRKKTSTKRIHCYNRANFDGINSALQSFSEDFLAHCSSRSVETNWKSLKDTLTNLVDKFVPVITIRYHKNAPWFTNRLRRLNNKKKRLYRQAVKTGLPSSWTKYRHCDHEYQSLLNTTRHHFFSHDLSTMLTNNCHRFWRVINPSSHPEIVLTNPDGDPVTETECAQLLNDAFVSVFTHEDTTSSPMLQSSSVTSMPEIIINESGILALLNNLKVTTSSDHLGFNNKILKNASLNLYQVLTSLFSQSLSSGTIPDDWRTAKVIPIFKSGDRTIPLNYRPISLTSNICKLLEHIIHTQVINYLEEHDIIFKYQHGFRRGYSCDTQLTGFTNDIFSAVDAGLQVDAVFLDYSKAFDRVPHHRLLTKLTNLNLHPSVISWIKQFLDNRKQFTSVNGFNSSSVPVTSGVPQGSVLGPLLFLIFINDLPKCVSSQIRLFADDCVIYRNITNETDRQSLQTDLDAVTAWCSSWLMSLNASKTKLMSFTNRSTRIATTYFLNNDKVELTTTYKYLGVHFQSDLTWHYHINTILASANRALGLLRRNLKHAPSHLKKLAYITLIRPKVEYASAIWDPHQAYIINNLESLQNRAVRFIFSDYSRFTSVTALKQRAELEPLSCRRHFARLTLLHKLYHHPTLHDDFFLPHPAVFPRRDHVNKIKRVTCRSLLYSKSFIPRTIIDWNNLPSHIATEVNPQSFQHSLKQTMD